MPGQTRRVIPVSVRLAAVIALLAAAVALADGWPGRTAAQSQIALVVFNVAPNPPTVFLGQTVTFSYQIDINGVPSPFDIRLDFGDGNADAFPQTLVNQEQNPQNRFERPYVYAAPGTYTARLRISLPSGMSTTQTRTIIVVPPLVATTPTPTATATAAATPTPSPTPTGAITVSVAAGWNLIGGPTGTVISTSAGSLFTLRRTDTDYQVVPSGTPLIGGQGYWAFFNQATTFTLPAASAQTVTVQAPAGRYFMVGNPGVTPARVSGADVVYVYNASLSRYDATTMIPVGGGAWVFSAGGATITVGNTMPLP